MRAKAAWFSMSSIRVSATPARRGPGSRLGARRRNQGPPDSLAMLVRTDGKLSEIERAASVAARRRNRREHLRACQKRAPFPASSAIETAVSRNAEEGGSIRPCMDENASTMSARTGSQSEKSTGARSTTSLFGSTYRLPPKGCQRGACVDLRRPQCKSGQAMIAPMKARAPVTAIEYQYRSRFRAMGHGCTAIATS